MNISLQTRRKYGIPRSRELLGLVAVATVLLIIIYMRNINVQLTEIQDKWDMCFGQLLMLDGLSVGEDSKISPINHSGFFNNYDPLIVLDEKRIVLNNTRNANPDSLVFNRVPKVGSETFMTLLHLLSIPNGFNFSYYRPAAGETVRLNTLGQMELIILVSDIPKPSVYVKHVAYTNFTLHGLPEPIYFNMVRDPIERVISWFYYTRREAFWDNRLKKFPAEKKPDANWFKKDFETCVLEGEAECTFVPGVIKDGTGDHRRQTLFFCGHDDLCMPFNSAEALERAKYVVDKTYAVVGILEDLNTTLTVLEHYIPKYFKGITNIYWDDPKKFREINKSTIRKPVSEETKNLLRKNFTNEIEFYHYCRQRLNAQYSALKLKN